METNTAPAAIAPTAIKTVIFDNHLPLRTRQEIREVWLGPAKLNLGGRYFRYCRCCQVDTKWHGWYWHDSPYPGGRSYGLYLGAWENYETLASALSVTDEHGVRVLRFDDVGQILADLDAAGEIRIPEC